MVLTMTAESARAAPLAVSSAAQRSLVLFALQATLCMFRGLPVHAC